MKEKSETTKKFGYAMGIVGLSLLFAIAAALWVALLCYSVAATVAWQSTAKLAAMVFCTFFGASLLAAGLTVFAALWLGSYLRKVWFVHYPAKGKIAAWLKIDGSAQEDEEVQTTKILTKRFVTPTNCGYALLLVAVVMVIISAALGSIKADNWVEARRDYMEERGYHAQSIPVEFSVDQKELADVSVSISGRKVVVRYSDETTMFTVEYYELFQGEYIRSTSADEEAGSTRFDLSITRREAPELTSALDRMMALCFAPNVLENQVVITIPESMRDRVTLDCETIIYAQE